MDKAAGDFQNLTLPGLRRVFYRVIVSGEAVTLRGQVLVTS